MHPVPRFGTVEGCGSMLVAITPAEVDVRTRNSMVAVLSVVLLLPSGCGSDESTSALAPSDGGTGDGAIQQDATADGTTPDASVDGGFGPDAGMDGSEPECGDDTCNPGEDCTSCPSDCGECPEGTMMASVSQYGVTWTFDKEYPCGQFATGDWWCVGPVTVQSVSPAPTGERNGSMINPVGDQAYDARAGAYDGTKGVAFPLTLDGIQSLVSSISHPDTPECTQGSADGWLTYDGGCQRGPISTQAVLTVVPEPQELGTFRPPYAGDSAKPLHRPSSVCWGMLPKLPVPSSAPSADVVLRHVERPWIDHLQSWTMQHGCATNNMYCYGRDIGNIVAIISQYVLLDTPEQAQLATRFIQLGIDNYGVLQAGGGWGGDGGHFNGRKWPIVFAGAMLNESGMKSPGLDIGNEDRMTYVGANGKALWGRACDACYFPNGCAYSGTCTNGAKDCHDPEGLVDGCADYRNCCTSVTWVGTSLAAQMMGLKIDWGHDPFFDYVDRWMDGDVPGGGATSSAFVTEMWTTYRNDLPTPGSCP